MAAAAEVAGDRVEGVAELRRENAELRERLEALQAALAAVRSGSVDAIVAGAAGPPQVFMREGAETHYRTFVEAMHEGAATVDAGGCILYVNRALARLLNRARDALVGVRVRELVAAADRDRLDALLRSGLERESQRELRLAGADGSLVPALATAAPLGKPGKDGPVALEIFDLREREESAAARAGFGRSERQRRALLSLLEDQKHAQEALERVNRTLKTLSAGNSAVVHAQSEDQLLRNMCEAVVKVGGYKMAWVGVAEQDEARTVRAVAMAGEGADYVREARVTWADSERGRGPVGQCIRSAAPQIVADVLSDPSMAPWLQQARLHGYRSTAALPLLGPSGAWGAFAIYSEDPSAFGDAEMALLSEMAGDLAYGIANMRTREAQRKADEQVRVLARFPEENPNAVMRVDAEGVMLYANPASRAFRQACGARVGEAAPEPCRTLAGEALTTNAVKEEELELGDTLYAVTLAPVAEGGYVNVYAIDITARRHAEQTLQAALIAAVGAIGSVVEKRDPYTAGHQRRVAELASAIARELGWPPDRIHGLRLASSIHDVGKISVPTELLVKPGRLIPLELELVKRHAEAGFEIMKGVTFPWPIADTIRQHHERLDGSGYPQGLKGDQIVPEAQVLAVADVVEAMSSHRPYRPSLGLEVALKEIEAKRGVWYEAGAVDACLRLCREKGFKW